MPRRLTPFINGGYYHVFNRGVNKQTTYFDDRDYTQALISCDYYRYSNPPLKFSKYKTLLFTERSQKYLQILNTCLPLVNILSFVFMPNHFHFLLKQNLDNGVSKFISQLTNSYTKYFNTAHNRSGHLFQGQFKSVEIESNSQLIHTSRYIHLNPLVAGITNKDCLANFKWSSYPEYLNINSKMVNREDIFNNFKSTKDYTAFVMNHADYAREIELIKHLTIDLE